MAESQPLLHASDDQLDPAPPSYTETDENKPSGELVWVSAICSSCPEGMTPGLYES